MISGLIDYSINRRLKEFKDHLNFLTFDNNEPINWEKNFL